MKVRFVIVATALGGVLASGAGAATRPPYHPCRPVTDAGKKWAIVASAAKDCAAATSIVRGLAGTKVPTSMRYNLASSGLSAYAGWQCLAATPPRTPTTRFACKKGAAMFSAFGI